MEDQGVTDGNRNLPPLPPVLSTRLVVKVGEAYGVSRTTYGRAIYLTLTVADGYNVFHAKAKKKMEQFKDVEWSHDSPIMLKPTQNASQSKYEELSDDDLVLISQLTRLWGRAGKRKSGTFEVELFVYVQKRSTSSGIRRATSQRIADAAAQIDAHLDAQESPQVFGPAARSYWAIHQARQPPETPIAPPTSNTFTQLQFIDQQQERIDEREQSMLTEYVAVRCRLNGGVISLELNVADLQARLGLPRQGLVAPFRNTVPPGDPQENMEDVDHIDETRELF